MPDTSDITAPPGWTTSPSVMKTDYYWPADEDVRGTEQAKARGLADPQPLMRLALAESGDMYLFKSGDKFYIWNVTSDVVSVIKAPVEQGKVLKALGEMAVRTPPKDLKMEEVPVSSKGTD
ncbi:hypothetical protein F5144DRAFT_630304 [Chaetomium tenue]|uniref:Uncharacterized protein n=1 Tax=Chaetomium tenue TaxID=1854479 RepID=A0ACB7PD06_9PEZI|nr:hypothetical protein F5144DRAFT_630304 [Chaetomium globosum]